MSSLYSCEWKGSWLYRERLQVSDGTAQCCESNILIPSGQPYALCQPMWSCYEDLEDLGSVERERRFNESSMPQCIEVWRFLRRNNRLHGACPSFGEAVQAYADAIEDEWEENWKHRLRYAELARVIRTAKARYEVGGGPTLHPSEERNIESGVWLENLAHATRKRRPE